MPPEFFTHGTGFSGDFWVRAARRLLFRFLHRRIAVFRAGTRDLA